MPAEPPPPPPPVPPKRRMSPRQMWLVAGAVVLIMVIVALGSGGEQLTLTVGPLGDTGDFAAEVTNPGSGAVSGFSCTVRALDRFGNRIGFDIFQIPDRLDPGETMPWSGHVQVDEAVSSFTGDCET